MPAEQCPEELRPLLEKTLSIVDGKSAKQLFLEVKSAELLQDGEVVVKQPGWGDGAWEKWMWEFHVELIKEDKVPGRNDVPRSIQKEFAQYQSSKRIARLPSPEEVAQVRRQEASWKVDALIASIKELIGDEGDDALPPCLPLMDADRSALVVLEGYRVKLGEAIKAAQKSRH